MWSVANWCLLILLFSCNKGSTKVGKTISNQAIFLICTSLSKVRFPTMQKPATHKKTPRLELPAAQEEAPPAQQKVYLYWYQLKYIGLSADRYRSLHRFFKPWALQLIVIFKIKMLLVLDKYLNPDLNYMKLSKNWVNNRHMLWNNVFGIEMTDIVVAYIQLS